MTESGDLRSIDGAFWRRFARWGARGPGWVVRTVPAAVGLIVWAVAAEPRRAIGRNLRRVRGERGALRDVLDVARTFVTFAYCLTEVLGADSKRLGPAHALVRGELHMEGALADGRGVVLVTAHTGGWEIAGPLLARDHGRAVMIVEAAERDEAAGAIQDGARRAPGLFVTHVGDDVLSALPLVRHLRGGGVVAIQIDRAPRGARGRDVIQFGGRATIPEGPLRLAMLTGAPIVPVFVTRAGHLSYEVTIRPAIRLVREATAADLDAAAQEIAEALETFAKTHPTQWFHFRSE